MLLKLLSGPWRMIRWALLARPIRFTRFGTFYVLFSLAVGAAAINTGNNLLYLMLGLLLGFIIVSGVLSDSCLWNLEVDWQPAGDFYVGQAAEMDLTLYKGWFPAILLYLEPEWNHGARTRHLIYWVARRARETFRFKLPAPATRGYLRLTGMRYATRFPFGLFEKSHQHDLDESWVVFPRIEALSLHDLSAPGFALSAQTVTQKGQGTTPFDLRDYRSGDSHKRIHWKTSARRQRLMVTEMEEERDLSRPLVVTRWLGTTPEEREAFIAFVASLAFALHRSGKRVGLSAPGAFFPAETSREHLKKILTYLALVDPQHETALPLNVRRFNDIDVVAIWNAKGGA